MGRTVQAGIGLFLAVVVAATGCTADEEASADDVDNGDPTADFCGDAEAFIYDRSVTDVRNFDAEFFASVDRRLGALIDNAPPEVESDLRALRTGFADSDRIFAELDYDVTDPGLADALAQVDDETMLSATAGIERYLVDDCGVEPPGTIDQDEVADIMAAFGVDRQLAECLNAELGDVANIDPEQLTPELMQRPVCGTSLIALLAGGVPSG